MRQHRDVALPPLRIDDPGPVEPIVERVEALGGAGQAGLRGLGRQATAEPDEPQPVPIGAQAQAGGELRPGAVEALARLRQELCAGRQGPGAGPQGLPGALEQAQRAAAMAGRQTIEAGQEVGPHRHREFGRPGRGRGPEVGRVVEQRPIGLVPHRRDERDEGSRPRP